ncbi:hypothetical protein, partial [Planktothrix sp.]|uniref:hypothetical protein n=1 Tax=Planktothrix sp. TaxID=3088171 RepID=UPI0038D3FD2A
TKHSQYRIKFMPTKSDIYKLVEMIDSLWEECDKLKKSSKQYQLNRKKIERLKRIIKPVGTVRNPQLTIESKCLICQFRYIENGNTRSKNFQPELYDIINHAVKNGDTILEIIRLIEHKGDRKKSLGCDYDWVINFELELKLDE